MSVWQIPDAVCAVLSSWWWTEKPSETCRASHRNKQIVKRCILLAIRWKSVCASCYTVPSIWDCTYLFCQQHKRRSFLCALQATYTLQSHFHSIFWISRITIFGNEQKWKQKSNLLVLNFRLLSNTRQTVYGWRQIEARSCNHCCSGKSMYVLHILNVCL